jgi:DNA-binding transcriptional regulator YiaG
MMKGMFMPMPSTECRECGGIVTRVRKDYHYKECGLQNVMLAGINVSVCSTCHAEQPEIISIAALHRAIMIDLLKKRSLLCGEEIRYLRKMARFKASELAAHISADPTSISKWENNERKIGAKSDRVIRLVCYTALLERLVRANSEERITGDVARVALAHENLNVLDLLRRIEDKSKGPKKVSIDAGKMLEFGGTVDIGDIVASPGIQ